MSDLFPGVQPHLPAGRWVLAGWLLAGMSLLLAPAAMADPKSDVKPPAWLSARIATYENSQFGTAPSEIWTYQVKGKPVYFIPAACCDRFSELLDAKGHLICAPDGGIDGKGDKKCKPVHKAPKQMTVVWQDARRGMTTKPPVDNTK
jgi:hypothetical protein